MRDPDEGTKDIDVIRDLPVETGFAVLEALPYYVMLIKADHQIVWCNEAFASTLARSRAECCGQVCPKIVHGVDGPFEGCPLEDSLATGRASEKDVFDERYGVWIRTATYPTGISIDGQDLYLHIARDVTEERRERDRIERLREQRDQLQKLEAAGLLSAGIVHDINNLLSVTLMNASFLEDLVDEETESRECVEEILDATRRCVALTQRFLFLSRAHPSTPEVLDVNEVITCAERLLNSVLGSEIRLDLDLGDGVAHVFADATGLEQALVNIAVNARDAIRGPGAVRITTRTVTSPEGAARPEDLLPGVYTVIRIDDTGCGMDEDIVRRAFEPFFTTKDPGRGTGLGLKVVHDIVRTANGGVRIDSTPGEGTRFELFFPVTSYVSNQHSPRIVEPDKVCAEGRTIFIVADHDELGRSIGRSLEGLGCRVLALANTRNAVERTALVHEGIDLVIVDADAPKDGLEILDQLRRLRPTTRGLLLIDLTATLPDIEELLEHRSCVMLRKPFTREELLCSVVESLGPDARDATEKADEAGE